MRSSQALSTFVTRASSLGLVSPCKSLPSAARWMAAASRAAILAVARYESSSASLPRADPDGVEGEVGWERAAPRLGMRDCISHRSLTGPGRPHLGVFTRCRTEGRRPGSGDGPSLDRFCGAPGAAGLDGDLGTPTGAGVIGRDAVEDEARVPVERQVVVRPAEQGREAVPEAGQVHQV